MSLAVKRDLLTNVPSGYVSGSDEHHLLTWLIKMSYVYSSLLPAPLADWKGGKASITWVPECDNMGDSCPARYCQPSQHGYVSKT